ncbi:NAD-dependent epimerase/dehydratase family protein [Allobranchiibius sp. GilTou38]|uniref:NAD-dependent epimerase/dehydratase family protein n=1 Tax=Allobranchiibius sp. GilTou38 TaxID=2815210 RepID=UPI001AA17467|nr:NAD-dependent epimerase/dehydratase family protein [Allobranchiibius sp. GilTou38]MBO1765601.1 NAD-dependent epimerase/dehydratase family protein [Allobranchiibius sp. GilTou38]
MTRTLVLGGTHFVGHAVVAAALARGHDVTTLTRGESGSPAPGATGRHADRTDPAALAAALGDDSWDLVVDTWSGSPRVVRDSSRLLSGRARHYAYVSSRSVYEWPIPVDADESAPVVDADPDGADSGDYAAAKRGGELAVQRDFDGPALIARAGLILGPREDVGRLPWWLRRMAAGGPVPSPGPRDRPLQYIDARDLAEWLIDASASGVTGAYNAVSQPGHTTIGELLDLCRDVTGARAELVWVTPEDVDAAGVQPWTELPIWLPPSGESAGLHAANVSAAYTAGLTCRPAAQTVEDTWAWVQDVGDPPLRPDRPAPGMSPDAEARLLARADDRS